MLENFPRTNYIIYNLLSLCFSMHTYLQVINGSFVIGNFPNSLWVTLNFMPRKASCHSIEWPEVFAQVGLFFLFFVCIDYALYTHTHIHTHSHSHTHIHTYESSFISWLSVLAIFLGGAGLSPSPCSCSLFFAAFFLSHC